MKLYVTEIDRSTSKHTKLYVFDVDDGKNICYRSRVSSNAFFHSTKQRNWGKSFIYVEKHKEEFDINLESTMRVFGENIYKDCTVNLNNLWEFYNAIGYNYKQKKYL